MKSSSELYSVNTKLSEPQCGQVRRLQAMAAILSSYFCLIFLFISCHFPFIKTVPYKLFLWPSCSFLIVRNPCFSYHTQIFVAFFFYLCYFFSRSFTCTGPKHRLQYFFPAIVSFYRSSYLQCFCFFFTAAARNVLLFMYSVVVG